MRAILPIVAMLLASPAFAQAPAVDIAPFLAHEINPKVHLLTTPDDWYAAAIGNVVLILALGRPILGTLERYRLRFTWQRWLPEHHAEIGTHPQT